MQCVILEQILTHQIIILIIIPKKDIIGVAGEIFSSRT
jgi:hypothetical protein